MRCPLNEYELYDHMISWWSLHVAFLVARACNFVGESSFLGHAILHSFLSFFINKHYHNLNVIYLGTALHSSVQLRLLTFLATVAFRSFTSVTISIGVCDMDWLPSLNLQRQDRPRMNPQISYLALEVVGSWTWTQDSTRTISLQNFTFLQPFRILKHFNCRFNF